MPAPQQQSPAPTEPQQEGSRWRYVKPSSEEVATWFTTVPLDEGMKHGDYVAGVVLIPATEKVKKPNQSGGTMEVFEQTFTPYVRVDTRVSYFRALAAKDELIAVIEPVLVPRSEQAAFENRNMPDGFWWHIMGEAGSAERFLCCTMRVALYTKEDWAAQDEKMRPVREGVGTKQVTGRPEINALAKAETGAIGRALGVAGILVIGTGIATAEDMADLREAPQQGAPVLPEGGAPEETSEALNERLIALQARLRPYPDAWREFSAWWSERAKASGWNNPLSTPIEVRRGMASKMEGMLAELPANPPPMAADESPPQDSSQAPAAGVGEVARELTSDA